MTDYSHILCEVVLMTVIAYLQYVTVVIDVRKFQQTDYHHKQENDESSQFVVRLHLFVFGHFLNVHLQHDCFFPALATSFKHTKYIQI